jgi:Domain of unknown function (DUF4267)
LRTNFDHEVKMNNSPVAAASVSRSIAIWMAVGIALLQGFYAMWAFVAPQAVASYRGGSLDGDSALLWVHAYGSRTLFIALVVLLLLRRGDLATLKWVTLFGLVMPISDAWSAMHSANPEPGIVRHVLTAAYLLLTFAMLARASYKTRE